MKNDSSDVSEKKNRLFIIAVVVTPWQLAGVEVFLNSISSEDREVCGELLLLEHPITGASVQEKDCISIPDTVHIVQIQSLDGYRIRYNNVLERYYNIFINTWNNSLKEGEVYVLNPGGLDIGWINWVSENYKERFTYVIVDDGTGGYNNYRGLNKERFSFLKNQFNLIILNKMKKDSLFIDNRLFDYKNKCLYVKRNVSKMYRENITKNSLCIDREIVKQYENEIIINTQCFFDNCEIDGNQDINTFKVLNDILKKRGICPLVKCHPRESSLNRYDVFNWKFASKNRYTQEEIFSQLNEMPKLVIGITSSTLINLNALFDVKTVSLAKIFLHENLPNGVKNDVHDFITMARGTVIMPESMEELEKIIENIIDCDKFCREIS